MVTVNFKYVYMYNVLSADRDCTAKATDAGGKAGQTSI